MMSQNIQQQDLHNLSAFVNLLDSDHVPCMTKIWRPIIPNRKDRYLTPEELKLNVLQSPRIVELINELSANDETKKSDLYRSVQSMLNEIGLTRSLPIIRWLGICLNRILQRICTGVYVNDRSLKQIKQSIGNKPVLYLPSHRSYADFILMSYICFAYDLEIPGIAAGMDFHAMFGVGSMLRKTGAFFMRRSFSSDKLYWHVFKEYMRSLVNVYHTGVEFFIEGTRSRSFKALMPKLGLLSMALEPFFMGEVHDITIIPVGVAYEKPLEEQLFVYEMLGVPKPKESTMAMFKALKILDIKHGSMYVNFGQPMSVSEYFAQKQLDRFSHGQLPSHVQQLSKMELQLVNNLGQHVITEQQKLIVLTVFNLIALYYNYRLYKNETTNLEQMSHGVLLLAKNLRQLGALVAADKKDIKSKIIDSINVHSNILQLPVHGFIELVKPIIADVRTADLTKLKGHNLSPNTIRNAVPAFSLQIYTNPVLFWLAQPAFIILAMSHSSDEEIVKTEFYNLRKIFSTEFVFDAERAVVDYEQTISYLRNASILLIDSTTGLWQIDHTNDMTNIILSSMAPFLCCYYQTCRTIISDFSNAPFAEKEILVKLQQKIENGLNTKEAIVHSYCLSLDSISLAIQSFHLNEYLLRRKSENAITFEVNRSSESHILLHSLSTRLLQFCQMLPFNYLSDYLVLAKL